MMAIIYGVKGDGHEPGEAGRKCERGQVTCTKGQAESWGLKRGVSGETFGLAGFAARRKYCGEIAG